jgi:hypothetical protein
MAKTLVKIPNLISGISQQIPELRLPAQMEEQVNGLPSIKNGFGKRYGTEHTGKLASSITGTNNWHFIDRGDTIIEDVWSVDWSVEWGDTEETHQYAVAFGDETISAVNLRGRTEPVSISAGAEAYLDTPDPKNDLDFVSVKDFTFVLNKSKVTSMKTTVDTLRPFEALVFVAQAAANAEHDIFINDVKQATYKSGAASISTVTAAINLEGDLQGNLDLTEFTVIRNGSAIYIASLTGTDFNIRTEEGDGGRLLKVFKGSTNKFTELPDLAISGFRIKIENDSDFDEDDFWVEYESDSVTDQGRWKESRKDGLINIIDETTMPHQLVNNDPDIWSSEWTDEWGIETFSLTPIDWKDRLVGDNTSVPFPSFINNTINDIFYMRNRLGFLSGENVIQSEDSVHTNFWTTTLQTLLDSDPIDIGTSHTKSSVFRHAVPTQERILLFSNDTQFIYGSGDNVLSPKTTFINPSTEVSIDPHVRPFSVGGSVFFAVDKKIGTSIKEISTDNLDDVINPEDITSHVPSFVPKNLELIAGSNVDNMLFFYSSETTDTLYVYKFLDQGDERVLSSWHKWTFAGTGITINGIHAFRDTLYMVTTHTEASGDAKYIQKINLSPDFLNTGLGYPLLLDRLVTTQGSYDSTTNLTTWTLPYEDSDELKVIKDINSDVPGAELKQTLITRPTVSTVAYPGDVSANLVHIGKKFSTYSILTQPLLKASGEQGPEVDNSATFTVSNFTLDFFQSSGFNIEVTYKDGTVKDHKYSGFLTQNTDFTIGQFNFNTDSWHVPIRTKGRRWVQVKIESDGYVPFNPYGGRWIMNVTRKKGRF